MTVALMGEGEQVCPPPVKGQLPVAPTGRDAGRRKVLYALLALGVLALVVVVPVSVTQLQRGSRPDHSGRHLDADYCARLAGEPQALCRAYTAAQGAAKFAVASKWLNSSAATYVCAGVDAACLNADIAADAAGSACRPLEDGAACGSEQQCVLGVCTGVRTTRFDATGVAANVTAAPEVLRIPFIPGTPNASWPTASAAVAASTRGRRIPQSFLATSHEWKRMTDYGGPNVQAFANIFNMLSAAPVLRIGGSSQDMMAALPGPEVWAALKRLQRATNCKYIIGLPLHQKNATSMSRVLMTTAKRALGPALLGFELGNEPEFWMGTGLGGYHENGTWVPGFEGYAPYFHRVASALNPCEDGAPQLSGPGWGNVNTQDPAWFADVIAKGRCYLKEVNAHYYPYINNETVTPPELLSQWLQDSALDKFKVYEKMAREAGLDIRISETNSLYGGGRVGLSDTMVGAFWVADALFAFANAGAKAFHLHWGKGGEPGGNSQPNTGVQTNFEYPAGVRTYAWPSVHAPWYGYLFWTAVTAGGYGRNADSEFVAASVDKWGNCTANIKLWAVRSEEAGELRMALLNKDMDKSCNVELKVEPTYCANATLSRLLPGTKGIYTKAGITMAGQHYMEAGPSGRIQGAVEAEVLAPTATPDGGCAFVVAAPAITGTIIVAPRR